jgi:hypothetical protein
MKLIAPKSWLSLAPLILCLFGNSSLAQPVDLSEAPVEVQLRDGGTFKLFGLAYKGQTVLPPGAFPQSSIDQLLTYPPLHSRATPQLWEENSLILIYNSNLPGGRVLQNASHFKWIDENGYESDTLGNPMGWKGRYRDTDDAKAFLFASYPRRSKVMKLRIYSEAGIQGEVTVRNPFPTAIAAWPDSGLPQEKSAGDLQVKLLEAACSMEPALTNNPAYKGLMQPWTELKLQLLTQGKPETNWSVQSMVTMDATSNGLGNFYLLKSAKDGITRVRFHGALWPVETMKYHLGLVRENAFPSNQFALLKGLAVPKPIPPPQDFDSRTNTLKKVGFRADLEGAIVHFIGMQPESWIAYRQYEPDDSSEYRRRLGRELDDPARRMREPMILIFENPVLSEGTQLKINIYDEADGNEIRLLEAGGEESKRYYMTRFPETTKTVTIRFATQIPTYMEFTTKPKIIGVPPEPLSGGGL